MLFVLFAFVLCFSVVLCALLCHDVFWFQAYKGPRSSRPSSRPPSLPPSSARRYFLIRNHPSISATSSTPPPAMSQTHPHSRGRHPHTRALHAGLAVRFHRTALCRLYCPGGVGMYVGGFVLSQLQLALYALCQFFVLTTDGPLLGLVSAELLGHGGAAAVDENRRASTPPPQPHGVDTPATAAASPPPAAAAAAAAPATFGTEAVDVADGQEDEAAPPVEGGDPKHGRRNGDSEANGRGGGDDSGSSGKPDGGVGGPGEAGEDAVAANDSASEGANGRSESNGSGGHADGGEGASKADHANEVSDDKATNTNTPPAPLTPPPAEGAVDERAIGLRPEGNRYQRALLSCVGWRRQLGGAGGGGAGGAQVRLGAIAVLRSAVKNPSAAAEIVLGGAAAAAATTTERPGPAAGGGGGGLQAPTSSRAASAASAAAEKPGAASAMFDELARGLSPHTSGEAIEKSSGGGGGGSGWGAGGGRQELLSAASHGADGDGAPSVLDFMLPDALDQGRPKALSTTALGSASSRGGSAGGVPSVLDFALPGRSSPPAAAPPRRKSYHITSMREEEDKKVPKAGPEPGPGRPPTNDGIGPRPSKYLPRLERLWNGGALLFSERGDSRSGGGGRGGRGPGASGDGRGPASGGGGIGAGPAGGRQRSESFEQVYIGGLQGVLRVRAGRSAMTAAVWGGESCLILFDTSAVYVQTKKNVHSRRLLWMHFALLHRQRLQRRLAGVARLTRLWCGHWRHFRSLSHSPPLFRVVETHASRTAFVWSHTPSRQF